MNSRTGKTTRVLDNNIWKEYNKTNPPQKYQLENREELKKIVKQIFKTIAEEIIEKKAGVLIRGLGYFFNWKVPKKMKYTITRKGKAPEERYNFDTDMYMTLPTFLPADDFKMWSMDATFNRTLKKALRTKLVNGFKYNIYPYTFKKILNNE